MIKTLDETRKDLRGSLKHIRIARTRILAESTNGLLRATISGLLLGLESQTVAVNDAILELSRNPSADATASEKESNDSQV